jgi:hypothetical protein
MVENKNVLRLASVLSIFLLLLLTIKVKVAAFGSEGHRTITDEVLKNSDFPSVLGKR